MKFSDVIGQQQVKEQLKEMFLNNRLSHALLFLGKEGSGALPLAIAFAQYLVCEKVNGKKETIPAAMSLFGDAVPSENESTLQEDSCGVCPACLKAAQLAHPDIHFSYPTVTKKSVEKPIATDFISEWRDFIKVKPYGNLFDWIEAIKENDNSQGKITARECDDIIRKLSLKSFESGYKIVILWMPEELDKEANRLLKILEEPPPDTLIILVAENDELILSTILSRCQLIKVPALEKKEIEDALIDINTDATIARQAASVSDGNYRDALQLAQHTEEDWQGLLRAWLNTILKTGPMAQTKWVEEISKIGREKQKQFLRYFNHLLEQAILLQATGVAPGVFGTERDFAERLNKLIGLEQQQAIIEEIDKASYYIERNANTKILFHALTIKLYHIIQNKVVFLMN